MKKIFLMAVMAILAFTASAQVEKGFRMGVRVNLGMSNVTGLDGNKAAFGYGVGWIAEFDCSTKFYLQTGIGLENIAHKADWCDGTLNTYFAQIPIHAGYRLGLGDTTSLFVQAGPYIGIGLFGTSIEWYKGGTDNYFEYGNRFDLGVGARIGAEFNKFQVSAGFNFGFPPAFECSRVNQDGGHNMSANIGAAYMF